MLLYSDRFIFICLANRWSTNKEESERATRERSKPIEMSSEIVWILLIEMVSGISFNKVQIKQFCFHFGNIFTFKQSGEYENPKRCLLFATRANICSWFSNLVFNTGSGERNNFKSVEPYKNSQRNQWGNDGQLSGLNSQTQLKKDKTIVVYIDIKNTKFLI